ncbi:MAG: class I tRNA ligase family protein, partial [Candidatus Woesearchaeota archaeon]
KKASYWMPIDTYIGGKEHATMHLIYFRFFTKFLRDIGLLKFDEPCKRLFNQGMLHKDGSVMSKSKGNVVTQEEIADRYGIDTARFFLLFVASAEKDMEWDDKGVEGAYRFLNKLYLMVKEKEIVKKSFANQESRLHKTIKEVTQSIESFKYNQALISIMQFANYLNQQEQVSSDAVEKLLVLLAPFTPHICEELWQHIGNKPFVSLEKWPVHDDSRIDLRIEAREELVASTIRDIRQILELARIENPKELKVFVSASWKYSVFEKLKIELEKTRDQGALIKAVMVKEHSKEISQLVPRILKDMSKLPETVLDQETELHALQKEKDRLGQEFGCKVEIIAAEDSTEPKAAQAIPGKVAILVS